MNNIKNLFNNLDKLDLKIMKTGLKFCFLVLIFSVFLLYMYLNVLHSIFLFNLAIAIFKLSTYIAIEFVICGIVVDTIKKQID